MSYDLYQQTMKRLSQTLSDKFSIPIRYFNRPGPQSTSIVIPLILSRQTAGHLQVDSSVSTELLDEIYHHVQWTLSSLEDLFQKHGVSFQSREESFPVWISALSDQRALKTALDFYERSCLRSFVHIHASVFDAGLFSSDLKKTLIFISSAEQLSKESQLFLAHYLRTNKEGPSLIFSSPLSLEPAQKRLSLRCWSVLLLIGTALMNGLIDSI